MGVMPAERPATVDASQKAVRIEPLPARGEDANWDAYVTAHARASSYHQLLWRDLIKAVFRHDGHYLTARDGDDRICGILPLIEMRSWLFGHFFVSMPYFNYGGALGDSPEIEQQLMVAAGNLAASRGAAHVEFRDALPREPAWPARPDKVVMLRELPESEDALWKSLGSKLRAQIRRPQREQATVVFGREERLDDFYSVFARNMRDLGTPVYARTLFREVLRRCPESVIAVVYLQGKPVASGFLLGWRDRLEIPWASSLREYNRLGVNMLLYWECLKRAVEEGRSIFDFGRSSADSGTYRFKAQWGATPQSTPWHYWLPDRGKLPGLSPDNPKYALAISAWRRLPLRLSNLIGPAVVRNLP